MDLKPGLRVVSWSEFVLPFPVTLMFNCIPFGGLQAWNRLSTEWSKTASSSRVKAIKKESSVLERFLPKGSRALLSIPFGILTHLCSSAHSGWMSESVSDSVSWSRGACTYWFSPFINLVCDYWAPVSSGPPFFPKCPVGWGEGPGWPAELDKTLPSQLSLVQGVQACPCRALMEMCQRFVSPVSTEKQNW